MAVQRVFQLPFSLRVVMAKETPLPGDSVWNSFKQSFSRKSFQLTQEAPFRVIQPTDLNHRITDEHISFQHRFKQSFDLQSFPTHYQTTAQSAISNLVGSVSYFVGDTIQTNDRGERVRTPKGELLTCIPGRSFFPRGFVWDEGFHQLVLSEWNRTLSVSILKSWIQRMEESVGDIGVEC